MKSALDMLRRWTLAKSRNIKLKRLQVSESISSGGALAVPQVTELRLLIVWRVIFD